CGAIAGSAPNGVLGLPAVDVDLHAVVVARLPEHADVAYKVPLLPAGVVLNEVRKQVLREALVGVYEMDGPHGVGEPGAVATRLRALGAEPVAGVVACELRVPQPAHLVELMPRRTTDGAVGTRPERPVDELGERVPCRRRAVGEVLGDQLPAVV